MNWVFQHDFFYVSTEVAVGSGYPSSELDHR